MGILKTAPKRGDIIWLDFDPQKGREQKGHRPALVLSHFKHNQAYQLAIVAPITRQTKGFGIEVPLPKDCKVQGVVLSNQVRTIDWKERPTAYADTVEEATLEAVIKRIKLLIE